MDEENKAEFVVIDVAVAVVVIDVAVAVVVSATAVIMVSKETSAKFKKILYEGMEQLFNGKGFSGMTEEEKQRFLDAVTGEDGKVNSRAAAALIAAAASGGDPEVAERIIERMMSGLGGEDAEIDPAMMAALMATTAMAAQGASNEEV